MNISLPHARFNQAVLDGSVGGKLNRIMEETKPEAVYFTEYDGRRGAIAVVNLPSADKIPSLAEPWFLAFDADVKFQIAMKPDELQQAAIEEIGKRWRD